VATDPSSCLRALVAVWALTCLAACTPDRSNSGTDTSEAWYPVMHAPSSPPNVPPIHASEPPPPTSSEPPPPTSSEPPPPIVEPADDTPATPGDGDGSEDPVPAARKASYGHYFSLRYSDKASDIAMLCEQPGVSGVVWRQTWQQVEPSPGVYDFRSFDQVLDTIAGSHNPECQLWLFVEFKSFDNSPVRNPCPVYLQANHSGPNAHGNGAATCFMWEPEVVQAYVEMMRAAAKRFDAHPRVEGFVLQESALGFNGAYSQDVADGGTYTAAAWRDALVDLVQACGTAFRQSRCIAFLNFLRGGQRYIKDVAAALAVVPDNRGCVSGPDLLPDSRSLYGGDDSIYQVLVRHSGCRANSIQNDSYAVRDCGLDCIFRFGVGGTFGYFPVDAPRSAGVCVNSYLMWNHRVQRTSTGLDWTDALPVIAAYPYGRSWTEQCVGGGERP
jgi:hypothetical protein